MQQAEHPRSAGSLHAHLLLARLQVTPMHICDGIARPPKLAHARKSRLFEPLRNLPRALVGRGRPRRRALVLRGRGPARTCLRLAVVLPACASSIRIACRAGALWRAPRILLPDPRAGPGRGARGRKEALLQHVAQAELAPAPLCAHRGLHVAELDCAPLGAPRLRAPARRASARHASPVAAPAHAGLVRRLPRHGMGTGLAARAQTCEPARCNAISERLHAAAAHPASSSQRVLCSPGSGQERLCARRRRYLQNAEVKILNFLSIRA